MKTAYICFMPHLIHGVQQRYKTMANVSQTINFNCDFIILNNTTDAIHENLIYKKFKMLSLPLSLKRQQQLFTHKLIDNSIELSHYDLIILRYPGSCSLGARSFYKKYKDKLITEHHTNEDKEYQLYKTDFINTIKFSLEPYCARKYFKHLKAIIGVTQEIVNLELQKSGEKPALSLPNGIDVNTFPLCKTNSSSKKTHFNMIFVASNDAPWHGIDRVIAGIKAYNGPLNITLHIVGDFPREKYSASYIKLWGILYAQELDTVFQQCDVAISTMALHRKELTSAASLKTREYLARGMPIVYSYKDDDIPNNTPFSLNIGADDTLIDIDRVIQFTHACPIKASEIRKFAYAHLDWKKKLETLKQFLLTLDKEPI